MNRFAKWDAATASRVDRFVANSQYVAERIRRYYNRGSTVVYPPVDTEFYQPDPARRPDPYFLIVSALVPYKRVDVAIDAARLTGTALRIVGKGPEERRLRARAGAETEFLGWMTDEEIRRLYQGCTAVLMPGVEDFGMVPVEAMACGRPVIALGEGGATESVLDGTTGILVREGSVSAFAAALRDASTREFDPGVIRRQAERFSTPRFTNEITDVLDRALTARGRGPAAVDASTGSASPRATSRGEAAARPTPSPSPDDEPGSPSPAGREAKT
jgi:glycosyltransferase involved in cell wall biosynthesis